MNRHSRILASTALGLLMTSAPLTAPAFANSSSHRTLDARYLLAQAEEPLTEEELLKKKLKEQQEKLEQATPPAEEPKAPAAEEPKAPAAEEPKAPAEVPAPQPKAEQPAPEATPDKSAPAAAPEAPAAPKTEEIIPPAPKATEPAPEPQAPAETAPEAPKAVEPEVKPVEPTLEQPAPASEAPAQTAPETPAVKPVVPAQPADPTTPAAPANPASPAKRAAPTQPAAPAETQPAPAETQPAAPAETGEPSAPAIQSAPAAPATEPAPPAAAQPVVPEGSTPAPEGQAPLLDSQKQSQGNQTPPADAPVSGMAAPAAAPEGPPPADDRAAQQDLQPVEIQPVTAEQGKRLAAEPEPVRLERPQSAEVVREVGDRTIIQINNQIIVRSDDTGRLRHDAEDVYYEELSGGRTREVIVRRDGTRVVTIRDRYGDILRRSRITPDNREYVLFYVDEAHYDDVSDWRDPGLDLPPMRLTIPADEYILDAETVNDVDRYYAFLHQPPVERVERIYSVDEVKRSARIRDKVRRIDMDTIHFAFGSAEVAESEVAKLEGVARAMEKLLRDNPAETFLIEGHTDAVGSDEANLALSDRRAEAVAEALTSVFGIPPENLTPQGYGEQYLKVNTQERNQENRRVAIRRITPLVSPVASAR